MREHWIEISTHIPPVGAVSIDRPKIHESRQEWWKTANICREPIAAPQRTGNTLEDYAGERRFIADGALIHQSVFERKLVGGHDPPNLPANYQFESS